jgi:hypothetical protein
MKPTIQSIIFFMLFCPLIAFSQYTLYPPLNLQGEPIECNTYLTWEQPQLPGGGVPAGLIGYVIFRNGDSLGYVSNPATLEYYDLLPGLCSPYWDYYVTANYDLGSYGSPGQTGESAPSDTVSIGITCDYGVFPFTETWDQGSFEFRDWEFIPDKGNWDINTAVGNPWPSAVFTGTPTLYNYSNTFYRGNFEGSVLTGFFDLWLDFDLKLENINNTGTELFSVYASMCYTQWAFLAGIYNTESFDWTQYHLSLSPMIGSNFFVYFDASGTNSSNIQQWMLDNIHVYFVAHPPLNTIASVDGSSVELSWNIPFCYNADPAPSILPMYNIYRSDLDGNPPFERITTAPIEDTTFTQYVSGQNYPITYKYYVTAVYQDTVSNTFLAESGPSDTVSVTIVSAGDMLKIPVQVTPNPSEGIFRITLPAGTETLEVSDLRGKTIIEQAVGPKAGSSLDISLEDQHRGVYLLHLSGIWGTKTLKLVLE